MRIERREPSHRPVPHDLGDDRRGRDRRALLVAVDDGLVLGRSRAQSKAVDEADLGRRRQLPEDRPHGGEIRAVQAVRIDLPRRDRADGDLLGAADDGPEQRLARRGSELLRVVQQRERPHPVVAQAVVIQQDAGDDERSGEGPSPCLVRSGDETRAEAPVKL